MKNFWGLGFWELRIRGARRRTVSEIQIGSGKESSPTVAIPSEFMSSND